MQGECKGNTRGSMTKAVENSDFKTILHENYAKNKNSFAPNQAFRSMVAN
jgi:hypothetical protein